MLDNGFTYCDLQCKECSHDIGLLFPDWQEGDERLVILVPHDDDALLGAGYLIQAVQANGGDVYLIILCDGSAGYSVREDKETIVALRRAETSAAYQALRLTEDHILRCDYPDFSLSAYMGWRLIDGSPGTMQRILPALRGLQVTRLLVPNGYQEHIDHEATERIGCYDGPQVGDPVLPEAGLAPPVRSMLQYAVWGDFSPMDAFVCGRQSGLRANRAILAPPEAELKVMEGLLAFRSQARIIEGIVSMREARKNKGGWLELYLDLKPRPGVDYGPYHSVIEQMSVV